MLRLRAARFLIEIILPSGGRRLCDRARHSFSMVLSPPALCLALSAIRSALSKSRGRLYTRASRQVLDSGYGSRRSARQTFSASRPITSTYLAS